MGNYGQFIHFVHSGSFAVVWEPETAPDGLFNQHAGVGSPERNDGVQVVHIPTFFQHIHMDNDFDFVVQAFQIDKLAFDLFLSPGGWIYLKYLALKSSFEKSIWVGVIENFGWMINVAANYQNKRFYCFHLIVPGIDFQFVFCILMDADRIFQFYDLNFLVG